MSSHEKNIRLEFNGKYIFEIAAAKSLWSTLPYSYTAPYDPSPPFPIASGFSNYDLKYSSSGRWLFAAEGGDGMVVYLPTNPNCSS